MSADPDSDTAIVDSVFAVDEGDEVRVATGGYEWQTPMEVGDVDHTTWTGAGGEDWATRSVTLEATTTEYHLGAAEGDTAVELHSGDQQRGVLEQFEIVDETDATNHTCNECGRDFDSVHALNGHRLGKHTGGGSDNTGDETEGVEEDLPDTQDDADEEQDGDGGEPDGDGDDLVDRDEADLQDETPTEDETTPSTPEQSSGGTTADDTDPGGFPCIECDDAFDSGFARDIHRTEAHGKKQAYLGWLEPGEFETAVENAEQPSDIADALDWSTERVLRGLGIYGLEDVIGPNGVEISDLNEFEFDGVNRADNTDESATPDKDSRGDRAETDHEETLTAVLDEHGLDREDIVDAIAGAQTPHHVRRELPQLSRDDLEDVLEALGLQERLDGGSARIEPATAEQAVREVVR